MTTDEVLFMLGPIAAGIPSTLVGQWWAALAALAIIVLLRPRRVRVVGSGHHG